MDADDADKLRGEIAALQAEVARLYDEIDQAERRIGIKAYELAAIEREQRQEWR
ncbi:MAG: hypothetical protein KGL35_07985 [Bradyrhizobium sp.]|nr:hypothetical protein [Bradyrhizobium sp.]